VKQLGSSVGGGTVWRRELAVGAPMADGGGARRGRGGVCMRE
jgi:hypothetical protein